MEADPIGLEGGLNPFSYANQNPVMFVDSTGAIPLPIITGVIGGVFGGAASIGAQAYQGGINNIKWKDVGVAVTVGAIAGAVSPWTASTTIGAISTGAISNTGSYYLTQKANNANVTSQGLIVSAVLGGVGGKISGPVPKQIPRSSIQVAQSNFISKTEASRVNRNNNLNYAIDTIDKYVGISGAFGAIISADPMQFNNSNIRITQQSLESTLYGGFQKGNTGDWTSKPYVMPTIHCNSRTGCDTY